MKFFVTVGSMYTKQSSLRYYTCLKLVYCHCFTFVKPTQKKNKLPYVIQRREVYSMRYYAIKV